MATFVNFYENLQEALLRLKQTVVLYDGEPYYIWTICNHKPDGKFRVYMSPLEQMAQRAHPNIPALQSYPHGHASLGGLMDAHVDGDSKIPNLTIVRKNMDSPHFNKFRPFPLGMMNKGTLAVFVERQPLRPKVEQGLTQAMLVGTFVNASLMANRGPVSLFSTEFRDCIKGDYPSPNQALEGVVSDKTANESIAFHRNFALVRGPIGTVFLAYKDDVVGALTRSNFSSVKLGKEFKHLKEAVGDLNLFQFIE